MQTWKRRKPASQPTTRKWKYPALAIFFLLLTLGTLVFDFPAVWNRAVSAVGSAVGADFSRATISETPYRLGLDLQGGTHLVYEADMSQIADGDRGEALEGVRDVIERRVNAFGVSEPLVQTSYSGGVYRVIVELAGVLDVNAAIAQIGETPILEFKEENTIIDREPTPEEAAFLAEKNAIERAAADAALQRALAGEDFAKLREEFQGEDLPVFTANHALYAPIAQGIAARQTLAGSVVPQTFEIAEGLSIVRVVERVQTKRMELSHILVCWEGKIGCQDTLPRIDANITVTNLGKELTPENFAEKAREFSDDLASGQEGGYLGWIEPGVTVPAFEIAAMALPVGQISQAIETEFGYHLIYKHSEEAIPGYRAERLLLPLTTLNDIADPLDAWKNTELSGKQLKRSAVEFDPNTGTPYVTLTFDDEGGKLFADITARNVGKFVAIFLDGAPISVPQVNEAIYGGQAVISGDFTIDEAKLLAQRLNAGALPVPIELVSQQTVGPTLGSISLDRSITAGLIGFALVALFMIALYRLPGLLAVVALALYMLLNLAAYRFFDVTITLSGIAGFVLSMGMAVDANVLIFERMKEELRAGRDLRGAIDEGFKRAWAAIRDGNLTTLIAAAVLYSFSSSFIKGFALTLTIGVLLSMFTAIYVTRAYLRAVDLIPALRNLWLYAAKRK